MGEKAATLEAEAEEEVTDGVGERVMAVAAGEEATVEAAAEDMTEVPIVDMIAAKTGIGDLHPSRKGKK